MGKKKHSLVFSHRGANQEAAENTRLAFDRALAYQVDGIETDVQLTRDEITVLWHDRFLDKAGMPERRIDDFNYHELTSMKIVSHSAPHADTASIMRLQEFVISYRNHCRLLIEIKNREWERTVRHEIKVQQTLNIIGPVNNDSIVVSSFNLDSLVFAHQYKPGFSFIYNLESDATLKEMRHVLAAQSFLHGLCIPICILNADIAALLQQQQKYLAVYTCNSDEEISKALELGVDILISDLPKKAIYMRNAYAA